MTLPRQEHGSSHGHASGNARSEIQHGRPYRRLAVMAVLSFVAMYFLMFAMVDRLANVVLNFNQLYMATLMAAPMVLIELLLMTAMYRDRKRNAAVGAAAALVGLLAYLAIRGQWGVGDREFARSMVPHHASAILMCNEARITTAEIRELCDAPNGIVQSQRREIEQLRVFLHTPP